MRRLCVGLAVAAFLCLAAAPAAAQQAPKIAVVDGNKLTIDFDKAGQKRVLDSFVEGV